MLCSFWLLAFGFWQIPPRASLRAQTRNLMNKGGAAKGQEPVASSKKKSNN
jgi:hypothetical protein